MTKNEMRNALREKRFSLESEFIRDSSMKMLEDITSDPAYQNAEILYVYVPTANEIDTNALIARAFKDEKKVAVPVCISSEDMVFQALEDKQKFCKNRYEILEPVYNPNAVIDGPGLMIVPIVGAVGKYRLGMGKNYFNNFLKDRPYIHTIGVGYDFQRIEESSVDFSFLDERDILLKEIRTY